eukprot:10370427-Alexandrium_andersonii.AAC.1
MRVCVLACVRACVLCVGGLAAPPLAWQFGPGDVAPAGPPLPAEPQLPAGPPDPWVHWQGGGVL